MSKYKEAADLINGGMTSEQAAAAMGTTVRMLNNLIYKARKMGLDVPYKNDTRHSYRVIAEMRNAGMTNVQIADKTGLSIDHIRNRVKVAAKNGLIDTRRMSLRGLRDFGYFRSEIEVLPVDVISAIMIDCPDDMTIAKFVAEIVREKYAEV